MGFGGQLDIRIREVLKIANMRILQNILVELSRDGWEESHS